jgi:glycosyltransferase involved in cell wall biosynthesis
MPDVALPNHVEPLAASLPKIAIVSHGHPSVSKGGAEISAYALYQGLRSLGANAIFIAACGEADRARLAFSEASEFALYYDPARYDHFFHLAPPSLERELVSLLAEQQVRIVNFHHFLHFGVNTLRAVRALPHLQCYYSMHEYLAICHHHGQMVTRPGQVLCPESSTESCTACYPEFRRTQFVLRKRLIQEVLRSFDGCIAPSRFLKTRYVEWGLPAERISVIDNGLLEVPAAPRAPRSEGQWTFGYFGQINPFKGVDLLLDAAALLAADAATARTLQIRIHGNLMGLGETFLERFEKARREIPLLKYSGAYLGNSVYRLMSECDYVIVPSKWWENSPVVIREAFAVGTPVICSGLGGLAEKVSDQVSGLHFKVGDALDLVRVMKSAATLEVLERLRAGIPPVHGAADMAREYLQVFLPQPMCAIMRS